MKYLAFFLSLIPSILFSQTTFVNGAPDDLESEKIIFLKHEPVEITGTKGNGKEARYLLQRQTNHNKVIKEANVKLKGAALSYPYKYALSTPSSYESLLPAGYKYVLRSTAYSYENLKGQPTEDELTVHEYYIYNVEEDIAYKVFEIDEMKIYDFKLIMRKLKHAIN